MSTDSLNWPQGKQTNQDNQQIMQVHDQTVTAANNFDHQKIDQTNDSIQQYTVMNNNVNSNPSFSTKLLNNLGPSDVIPKDQGYVTFAQGMTESSKNVTPVKNQQILIQDGTAHKSKQNTLLKGASVDNESDHGYSYQNQSTIKKSALQSLQRQPRSFNTNMKAQTGRDILNSIPRSTMSVTSQGLHDSFVDNESPERQNKQIMQYGHRTQVNSGLDRAYALGVYGNGEAQQQQSHVTPDKRDNHPYGCRSA